MLLEIDWTNPKLDFSATSVLKEKYEEWLFNGNNPSAPPAIRIANFLWHVCQLQDATLVLNIGEVLLEEWYGE